MAKKSKIVKNEQRMAEIKKQLSQGKKPTELIKHRNRCNNCGRPRGYIRLLGLCRQCARHFARNGDIAGMTKSSW
jgi:small subunit ribosomal protein S14